MYKCIQRLFLVGLIWALQVSLAHSDDLSKSEIMKRLELDHGGKTEVVKSFPDSFPDVLTARGKPLVYTRKNAKDFEYIGMPVGGIGTGQLYLGGDGKLWFWDIFGLNYRRGQLKGEEAYQFPYVRSKPTEKGARMIVQGFSIRTRAGDLIETRSLDRDGIRDIEFLGQYPIGEVIYRDPGLPVEVTLEAFSPFIPLDLEHSILPATVLCFTVENISASPVETELAGWLENAVLIESRHLVGVRGTLINRITDMPNSGLRLKCSAVPETTKRSVHERPDILFDDFEKGYDAWKVEGEAFESDGKPYYHQQLLRNFQGKRLADSFKSGDEVQGRLSRAFKVTRKYVSCLVGGGRHPGRTCLNILVDGKVAATATGIDSETLQPVTLDVSKYEGQEAIIEIVDTHSGSWGHVLADHIVFTDRVGGSIDFNNLTDFGTMTLGLLGEDGAAFSNFKGRRDQATGIAKPLVGRLGKSFSLTPGAKQQATFLLTWHFPKTLALREQPETRYYAKRFKDATAVSDYLVENFDDLAGATRLWRDTWYDSTLPYWFLDRTFLNASILASSTSSLVRDRLFYGSEGGNQGPGTCTHVWGYVQAMGRLFPDLEKGLREQVDFMPVAEGGALLPDGVVNHRWQTHGLAVDGQSGCILRTYLAHRMSKDDAFLKRVYPGMKKAMQGLTEARDADHDGILTGPQHNTLDADWYGKVTWLSLHYTAALRAAAEMADEVGDPDYARFCRVTADKGRKYIEDHLFNGEYFFHEADPNHPDSPGTYSGLEYSQLLGQSWAYQVGLGEILDPAKTTKALESMWRYNFSTDVGPFREVHTGGRWYAMPGEGGLIACTWPFGGSEVLNRGHRHFANYNNECQNGYEYAATSLMMWHGMPYRSLAHIWYLHNDRYHGSKRNPWCEVEWGVHYSRSMASYGHFVAASGFEYHGPKGTMGFAPKIIPESFKSAFTAAEGWGSFEQKREDGKQTNVISVKHGALKLETLSLEVATGEKVETVELMVPGKGSMKNSFTQNGDRIVISLAKREDLTASQALQIEIK